MKTYSDLSTVIKIEPFLKGYTGLNYSGGIQHRIKGKPTNAKDKQTQPTDAERKELNAGIDALIKDLEAVKKNNQ